MAKSDHHSCRDLAAARGAPTPPRDQLHDPLAGLARLIDQSLPMKHLARDDRRPTVAGSLSAREFNPHAQHCYAAPTDAVQELSEEPRLRAERGCYDLPLPRADVSPESRSTWHDHEPDAADLHVESLGTRYDDEDQSQDHSGDHGDGEDYDEDLNPRRRGGFIFIAAVFGLALLGTAGAFAYRTPFADSIVPSLLSIIKAESGLNNLIPTSTAFQRNVSPQANSDNAGSSERLVQTEGSPADVPPQVSTAPQSMISAPIGPAPVPEPGAASVPTPLAQPAPATRMETPNSPPAVPVPSIPSADQAAASAAPTLTPASPIKPRPKKIRTVSIRTDQLNGSESAANQPQSVPVPPTTQQEAAKPSDANGPLSIVPSSNDAARAAEGSARTAPPAASVGKPAATKIASTSAAASGGGYAVQVSSQRNEKEVQSSFHALQAKYPKLLGGRDPTVRRADLGAKGIYYRTMVGPFVSAEEANELCSNLKAAGGRCIVQKN